MSCTSVDIFNVVRCLILFLPPLRQCTTLSLWAYLLALNLVMLLPVGRDIFGK